MRSAELNLLVTTAHEVAGEAKGKMNEVAGQAKGKKEEVKSKM